MMGNVMSALYGFTTSAFPLCYAVRIANSQEYALMLHSPSISSMSRLKLVPSASKSSNLPNVSNSINNALGKFSFDGRRSSKSKNEKHDRSASVANESIQPQMIQILGHQLAFSAFMAHLSNEFSMELLLSFVELTQYKKAVLDKLGLSKNDTMNVSISTNCTPNTSDQDADIEIIDEDQNIFRFHSDKEKIPKQQQKILDNPSIPLSFIVHSDIEQVLKNHRENSRRQSFSYSKSNNDEPKHEVANDERDKLLNEFQVRGFVLYCKYVDSSSEYQINISDEESKTLINKLNYRNKLNEHDLFTLYDKTLQELWQLLRHSYYRFIKTSEYQELLQYIQ